eukprot:scaffold200_cov173-Amphora_coffeaeformis.AAC.15
MKTKSILVKGSSCGCSCLLRYSRARTAHETTECPGIGLLGAASFVDMTWLCGVRNIFFYCLLPEEQ